MPAGKEVRLFILLVAITVLLASPAAAVLIDLGSYSVQDPRITVNYTEDIFLIGASLVNLEPGAEVREYVLRQVPPKDPANPTYITSYRLYTGSVEDPQYLVSGRYQLTLEALDRQGRPTLDIVEFSITGLDIVLVAPRFGFSPDTPFDVVFETSIADELEPSSCWYSRVGWDSGRTRIEAVGTYDDVHRIPGLAYNGFLYISCTEQSGRETRLRIMVGRDATPPSINASAVPNPVIDPRDKSAIVRVLTDDNSSCSIDGDPFPQEDPSHASAYRRVHEMRVYYNEIADTSAHEIDHAISCLNLAQLESERTLTVGVNFGAYIGITILEPSTGFVNVTSFTLRIRPTFDAASCSVNRQPMQERPAEEWASTFSGLQNGKMALNISCSGQGKNATLEHNISIDTIPPSITDLTAIATICSGNAPTATARWNSTDAVSGVASVAYSVSQGLRQLVNGTTVLSSATATLPRGLNGSLLWSVVATDLAGNRGQPVTRDAVCGQNQTLPPIGGGNGTGGNGTGGNSTGSGLPCFDDFDCLPGETCGVGGVCSIELEPVPTGACANGLLDIGEEDIDCGGVCGACVACFEDSECDFDQMCGSSGVCVPSGGAGGVCTTDFDCALDKECVNGMCSSSNGGITPFPHPEPTPVDESTDWLAISLIIVGLLAMTGAGWFLYQENQEKASIAARRTTSRPMMTGLPPSRASSGMAQAGSRSDQSVTNSPGAVSPRAAASPDRASQRKSVLGAFSSKDSQPAAPTQTSRAKKPAVKQKAESDDGDEDSDVFDKLDRIAKR